MVVSSFAFSNLSIPFSSIVAKDFAISEMYTICPKVRMASLRNCSTQLEQEQVLIGYSIKS
uniref:Uncharacterized protein n=1 Tax=Megaselia scalaris TaxID=36166 RepID=T1GDK0_MEGSC